MSTRKRSADEAVSLSPAPEVVRLSPVPGAYIPGEPAVEREVSPAEAERLLAFEPPAYVLAEDPPPAPAAEE